MASSMTGYAQARVEADELSMNLTLRSVNHRFLDVQLRVPPHVEPFESLIRSTLKKRLKRGQLQLGVSVRWSGAGGEPTINHPLAEAYIKAYEELADRHAIAAQPDVNVILRAPGVMSIEDNGADEQRRASLQRALTECLTKALDDLCRARQAEAEGIVADLKHRGEQIHQLIENLEKARGDTIPQLQRRLERRMADLLSEADPDPQRMLQEAAVLADRADISEEMQRLASHADRLLRMLEEDAELGKALDFLAQEMNRETNTILSKTTPLGRAGLPVTEIGLALKAEVEKIREQAQNLE